MEREPPEPETLGPEPEVTDWDADDVVTGGLLPHAASFEFRPITK